MLLSIPTWINATLYLGRGGPVEDGGDGLLRGAL
jgi:hypothetical protein